MFKSTVRTTKFHEPYTHIPTAPTNKHMRTVPRRCGTWIATSLQENKRSLVLQVERVNVSKGSHGSRCYDTLMDVTPRTRILDGCANLACRHTLSSNQLSACHLITRRNKLSGRASCTQFSQNGLCVARDASKFLPSSTDEIVSATLRWIILATVLSEISGMVVRPTHCLKHA